MQERRTSSRSRSFLGAKIIFNNRNSSLDCLIRNMSSTGARLVLSDTIAVPNEFELQIPKQSRSFRARLAWRTSDEFGVEFVGADEAPPVPVDLTLQVKKLEEERAALRARVAQLSSAE